MCAQPSSLGPIGTSWSSSPCSQIVGTVRRPPRVIASSAALSARSVHKLAAEYRERSGLTDVTTLVYPEARHEIFNETNREEVLDDVLAFVHEHV